MNLTELLLLGILIMQVISFHTKASPSGRYAKLFDRIIHRPTKYVEHKICVLCSASLSKGKTYYQKGKGIMSRR